MRYIDTTGGNANYTPRQCPLSEYGYNIVLDDADNNKGLQYSVSYDWRLEWIGEGTPVPITNGGHGVTVQFCNHVIWADNIYPYERPWVYFENETIDGVTVGKKEQSGHWQGTFQLTSEHISEIKDTTASKKDEKGIRCRVYYVPTDYRFYAYNFKMEQSAYPTPYYIAPEETDLWQYTGRNLLIGSQNFTDAQWKLSHDVRGVIVEPGLMCLRPTGSAVYARYRLNTQTYGDTYYPDNMYTVSYEARVCETIESPTAPETPELNKIWKDTSTDPATLKWWNQSTSTWVDCTEYTIMVPQIYLGYMTKARYDADTSTFGKSADTYGSFVPEYQGDGWHRYQETFVLRAHLFSAVQEQLDDALLTIQFAMLASRLPVEIRNVKLERGNKASAWSPAPEDAGIYADAAVDSLEIGGRNYILASGDADTVEISSTTQATSARPITESGKAELYNNTTDTLALSFNWGLTWTAGGTAEAIPDTAYITYRYGGYENFAANSAGWIFPAETWSGRLKTIVQLSAVQAAVEDPTIDIMLNDIPSGYTFSWWDAKLEKGNKATEWTPAPEDTANSITSLEEDQKNTQATLQGLQQTSQDIIADFGKKNEELITMINRVDEKYANGMRTLQTFYEQSQDMFAWYIDNESYLNADYGENGVITNTRSWMRFKEVDGTPMLEIGKQEADGTVPYAVQLSTNKLAFLFNGDEVAYMSNNALFIKKTELTQQMQLGNFVMSLADDNDTIVYS